MTKQKRVAVTLPMGPVLKDTHDLIEWAEAEGFTDGWFSDPGAPDSLTVVATLAPFAKTMRIGTAITPVYTRSPSVFAATANVIAQLLPGRFVMGLGASSQAIIERFNGIPLEKPLTRVKETAIMVRAMLAGEKTNFELTTLSSRGYSQMPLAEPPPIYLAGLRPKMLEMAAEVGDGVILNLWPKRALPKIMQHIETGAGRAGKSLADVEVVNRCFVWVGDKEEGRARFRRRYAPYYANPVYNRYLAWAGYEQAAAGIADGWAARDREKTAAAMTDEMIDEIAIIGSAEECHDRMREDFAGGIDTAIIQPIDADLRDEAQPTFDAFRPNVFNV